MRINFIFRYAQIGAGELSHSKLGINLVIILNLISHVVYHHIVLYAFHGGDVAIVDPGFSTAVVYIFKQFKSI